MEPRQRSGARFVGFVIHERAIALRDQEHALDVVLGVAGEVVFEIDDADSWRKVPDPQSVAGLFRLSRRSSECVRSCVTLGASTGLCTYTVSELALEEDVCPVPCEKNLPYGCECVRNDRAGFEPSTIVRVTS